MRHGTGSGHSAASRARRSEQGTSVLEFALVLPVLLAMAFCIIEAGNLYLASSTIDKAAGVAARFAVTGVGHDDGTRLGLIREAARAVTATLPGATTVTVRSWGGTSASGPGRTGDPGRPCELVEIRVGYAYTPVTPIIGDLIAPGLTLTGAERTINEPWLPCK